MEVCPPSVCHAPLVKDPNLLVSLLEEGSARWLLRRRWCHGCYGILRLLRHQLLLLHLLVLLLLVLLLVLLLLLVDLTVRGEVGCCIGIAATVVRGGGIGRGVVRGAVGSGIACSGQVHCCERAPTRCQKAARNERWE